MCKLNKKNAGRRIDPCMKKIIKFVNLATDFETVASCCGHGKYPPTIVIRRKSTGMGFEIFSAKEIERKSRFYKRDKQGFYYIPECV